MPSLAEVQRTRQALARLSDLAKGDLQAMWATLRTSDRMLMSDMLADGWTALIEKYGSIAAEIGADDFDRWARQLDIRPRPRVAPGVDVERATARLGWSLTTPNQLGNALVILDQLTKQPYRSTVQNSAWASGAAWARVPSGPKTCAFCVMLASRGAVYHSKELAKFGTEGKTYHGECVVEGTLVHGPTAKVALRRKYDGEVIVISTAGGHDLTVTPNHPVLTRRGWIPAGLLRQGDDLLTAGRGQGHVVGGPDEDDAPARVEDRFRALSVVGAAVSGGVPGAPEQFHGDGRDSEVEVVARDRLLWDVVQASFRQPSAENHLTVRSLDESGDGLALDRLRSGEVGRRLPRGTTDGIMGGLGLSLTLGRGHPRGAIESGRGPVSDLNACIHQPATNRTAGDSEGRCDRHLALTGEVSGDDTFRRLERSRMVSADSVTVIATRWYSGHVYNLSTEDGWYFANSIVTHNCDCAPVLVRGPQDYPDGYDPDGLYDQYSQARHDADSGDPHAILSTLRQQQGIH